ncbi:MAG: hypothetical protein II825_00770 [Paludibacteraceae bacterium]|nr:hypothetical protein [Paludibacteraceae bacterium]
MSKRQVKIVLIAMAVIACFAVTVSSLLRALNAPEARIQVLNTRYQAIEVHRPSSDAPKVSLSYRSKGFGFRGRPTAYSTEYNASQSPKGEVNPFGASPFTYRFSSATVHSTGSGGMAPQSPKGEGKSVTSNGFRESSQFSTFVPLMAVNSSAFSVNREMAESSGESVAGASIKRIAPPGDGGSTIGGTPNIAPPGDEGELLGSPVGDVPIVFMLLLIIYYIYYMGKSKTRSTHKN